MTSSDGQSREQTLGWQQLDREHYLHPFTNYKELAHTGSRIITRGTGVYIWDSDGNRILDGMAGLWCVNIGYGREELARAALAQFDELPYYNSFFGTATPPSIELARQLSEVTPPKMRRCFFTSSGSESVDTMLRIVRRFWELAGRPEKRCIIGRERAYHGSTIAGVALGGMATMHRQGAMKVEDLHHVMEPDWFRHGGSLSPDEFGRMAAGRLEEKILAVGPENVAAFVGEPIQGAGGVVIPPDSYWPEINRICREYDVLLVADEVITGFGRTGRWFGSQFYGIEAEIMTVAKGLSSGYLPIGAVIVSDRIAEVLTESGEEFSHGFTYSGHPVSCAVALANLQLLRGEEIVERAAAETIPYFARRWAELAHHGIVGEARTAGFLGALELVRDRQTRTFFDAGEKVGIFCRDVCIGNGVMVRAIGDTLVVAPPLIIAKAEIDELIAGIEQALQLAVERFT